MARPATAWAVPAATLLAGGVLLFPPNVGTIDPGSVEVGTQRAPSYEDGKQVFFHETFEGNGRTCATCHDPRNEFTMSPELAQKRYEADPDGPLFRPEDSDDGRGYDYTTLLTRAVFRVRIPLHPNVTNVDDPTNRTITVWRAAPSIVNVALTAPFLQDGRAETLQQQALGAIRDHFDPMRPVFPKELDALAVFENELFYPQRLRSLLDTTDPVPKEPGFSVPATNPAALRGKAVFDLHCRICHDGELFDDPSNPSVSRFANAFVSDANVPRFPLMRLAFRQPDGSEAVAYTPDPGRAAITGDLLDLNAFDTPSLRGIKHTAPYFHDHSAATLTDVVNHYNNHFQFRISNDERDDLVAFLELL